MLPLLAVTLIIACHFAIMLDYCFSSDAYTPLLIATISPPLPPIIDCLLHYVMLMPPLFSMLAFSDAAACCLLRYAIDC